MNKTNIIAGAVSTAVIASVVVAAAVFVPADRFPVVFTAPGTIEIGDVAVIDVSETGADSYAYSVTPPTPCLLFEDGKKLVFGGKVPGDYVFVIAAAKGGQVSIAEHTIKVEGGPGPLPGPDTFATQLKRAVSEINEPGKAEHLSALGGNFKAVASMIAAGVITTPEDAIIATYNLNTEALGPARQEWTIVSQLIQKELEGRNLPDMPAHMAAWREVAAILEGCR